MYDECEDNAKSSAKQEQITAVAPAKIAEEPVKEIIVS